MKSLKLIQNLSNVKLKNITRGSKAAQTIFKNFKIWCVFCHKRRQRKNLYCGHKWNHMWAKGLSEWPIHLGHEESLEKAPRNNRWSISSAKCCNCNHEHIDFSIYYKTKKVKIDRNCHSEAMRTLLQIAYNAVLTPHLIWKNVELVERDARIGTNDLEFGVKL